MVYISYQVVNVQSYNLSDIGKIAREQERSNGYQRDSIDKDNTKLNYIYKAPSDSWRNAYDEICCDVYDLAYGQQEQRKAIPYTKSKSAKHFEGVVITSDTAFFEGLGWERGKNAPKTVMDFFDKAYEWAKQFLGFRGTDTNFLSAQVHFDEQTPHLQLYYVPVVEEYNRRVYKTGEDGKVLRNATGSPIVDHTERVTGQPKVSKSDFWRERAKGSYSDSYANMQDDFYINVAKSYDLGRGEVGAGKTHQTYQQHNLEQLQSKVAEQQKILDTLSLQADKIRDEINKNQAELDRLKQFQQRKPRLNECNNLADYKEQVEIWKENRINIKMLTEQIKNLKAEAKAIEQEINTSQAKLSKLDTEYVKQSADNQRKYEGIISAISDKQAIADNLQDEIITPAQAEAEKIIADAVVKAKQIKADASADAERTTAIAEQKKAEYEEKLQNVDKHIQNKAEQMTSDLHFYKAECQQLSQQLAKTQQQLDILKVDFDMRNEIFFNGNDKKTVEKLYQTARQTLKKIAPEQLQRIDDLSDRVANAVNIDAVVEYKVAQQLSAIQGNTADKLLDFGDLGYNPQIDTQTAELFNLRHPNAIPKSQFFDDAAQQLTEFFDNETKESEEEYDNDNQKDNYEYDR